MTRIILLIGLILFADECECLAQLGTGPADSLRNALRQHPLEDSNRVSLLLKLADAVLYDSTDAAMRYADAGRQLSEKIKWPKGIALSFRQKGAVYLLLSDNLNAMDCYQKALKAGSALRSQQFDASVFNGLANIYSDLEQYEKALGYYRKLLSAARELKQRKEESIALINMGTVYTELKDFPRALDYFNKSLAIAEEDGNKRYAAFILNNLGILSDKQGDYPKALTYFQKSIQSADEAGNQRAKAPALNGLGKMHLNLHNYDQAEKYSLQSLALSKELDAREWQANAYQTLSTIYEKQRKNDQALAAYKHYITLRDSVLNDEKKSELTRKEMQFDFEKKEALLKAEHDKNEALAAAEIKRQRVIRNSAMAGVVVLLLAALSSFIFYKRRRDAEEQQTEAEFKAQVSDTEMKALRAQMNPHFIFNSLNSISDYIAKHDNKAADYYLIRFAKVMRLILEHSEQKQIRLSDELKVLELYMQLESLRLNNKFTYEIRVDEAIDQEVTLIPPLILQPFVENSIWHGLSTKQGEGKILIHIKREGEMLHCIVEDNGIGRQKSATVISELIQPDKKSVGMKITKARIDIINKIKKSNAAVELSDLTEGMRVEVKLPLELLF